MFIVYLLAISGVFAMMTDWDYFTAFYFLFNSVALIGELIDENFFLYLKLMFSIE